MNTCLIITWMDERLVRLPDLPETFGRQLFSDFRNCRQLLPKLYSLQLVDQAGSETMLALWSRDEEHMASHARPLDRERFIAAAYRLRPQTAEDDRLVDEHRHDQEPPTSG